MARYPYAAHDLGGPRRTIDHLTLTVLRVVVGVVMLAHGAQKVTGYEGWQQTVAGLGLPAPEVMARLGVLAELGGGMLLILGLITPLAALAIVIQMVAAIVLVHLPNGLFAADGGFEYPLTLAAAALFFLAHGPGPISVDALIERKMRGGERFPLRGYEPGAQPTAT